MVPKVPYLEMGGSNGFLFRNWSFQKFPIVAVAMYLVLVQCPLGLVIVYVCGVVQLVHCPDNWFALYSVGSSVWAWCGPFSAGLDGKGASSYVNDILLFTLYLLIID